MSYKQKLFLAKQFRSNQTRAEDILWQYLRAKRFLGLKFKRQYVTFGFIIDFYCPQLKLAIEVDGKTHNNKKELDKLREKIIKSRKIIFIRFNNQEIEEDINSILIKLKYMIKKITEHNFPSPGAERGQGRGWQGLGVRQFLLDLFFPIRCLNCGTWNVWLCPKCQSHIIHPVKTDNLYSLDSYKNPLLKKIIHQLKYNYSAELAPILSSLLKNILDRQFDYVIPVPLHRHRRLERGFNQSELLCQSLNLKILPQAIKRIRHTPPQAQLGEKQRRQNVKDCFRLNPKYAPLLRHKTILLVDDVYTTGSTLQACAASLKPASPAEIWFLVLAKG